MTRFVTRDGTGLNVVAGACPGDAAAVTLLLVHGWTQDHRTWDRVVPLLPPGVRVVRYDLRGHGDSDRATPETATIDRLADDLAEVIEELAPTGPLVPAGHSMGGMTIMGLADRYPDLVRRRVDAVAFVSTACGGMRRLTFGLPGVLGGVARRAERRIAAALAGYGGDRVPLGRRAAHLGSRWLVFGRRPARADVASVVEQLLAAHPASLGAFQNEISLHERRTALSVLRDTPSVVLAGTADRLCTPRHARAIADELGAGRLVLYPEAGHMLPQERAGDVAGHLAALCARARSGRVAT